MAYATQADIVEIFGDDALLVADRDGNGTADAAAVARALVAASEEIDSHIGVRYRLPLPAVPGLLRQLAVDIALYRLAATADVQSEIHRTRYEDALGTLKRLAEGKAALVLPPEPQAEPAPDTSPRPIVTGGPDRLFSRDQMRGL